jgi:uncharacterized protein YbbC (DUF1343 family)
VAVKSGLDKLFSDIGVLGDPAGVLAVTNHTAVTRGLVHLNQVLASRLGERFRGAVAPEHGLFGQYREGEEVSDDVDVLTGKPVYSWYSGAKGFRDEWARGVDTIVYDIQDGGVRYHTHLAVLRSTLEFCGSHGIRLVVLDRPNPIRGDVLGGNIPETTSIVCAWRVPVRYGLTPGELASLMRSDLGLDVDLEVVRLDAWSRDMWYDQTGMMWIPLSPNTPTLTTSTVYPGTCLFEGTELSVGRGTTTPFEVVGSPWIDCVDAAARFNSLGLKGVKCRPTLFTPRHSKYANQLCRGLHLHVFDRDVFDPLLTSLYLLRVFLDMYGEHRVFGSNQEHFDLLMGTSTVRKSLVEGTDPGELLESLQKGLEAFLNRAKKHMLYK